MRILILCTIFGAAIAAPMIQLKEGSKAASYLKNIQTNFDTIGKAEQINTINEFVDLAMGEISNLILSLGFDPMNLPDMNEAFENKLLNITGEIILTKGWLEDISTIHRSNDVIINYGNRILIVDIPFAFTDFMFDYTFSVALGEGNATTGNINGKINDIKIFTRMEIDFLKLQLTLNEFKMDKINKIDIKIVGDNMPGWLQGVLTGVVSTLFKGILNNVVESMLEPALQKVIELINSILAGIKP